MIYRINDRVKINNPIYDSDGETGTVTKCVDPGTTDRGQVLIVKLDSGEMEKVWSKSVIKIASAPDAETVDKKPESDFGIPDYLKALTPEKLDELIEAIISVRIILFGKPDLGE